MDYIIKIETILICNNFCPNGMRLLNSEANLWKSRVVNEAEQMLVRESAETAHRTTEVQKTMDKQFQTRWKEAEAQLRDMRESNSGLAQQRSKANWSTSNCILQMKDACNWRCKPSKCHKTWNNKASMVHQKEEEVQRLKHHSDTQPERRKAQ